MEAEMLPLPPEPLIGISFKSEAFVSSNHFVTQQVYAAPAVGS